MDVTGHITEISGDIPFHQRAINIPAFMVHFLNDPNPSGNGDLVPDRRRFDDGAQLLGSRMNGILDVFLKHRVELIAVHHPFSGKAQNQPSVFSAADVIDLQQMAQQLLIVFFRNAVKTAQRQHTGCKFSGRHLTTGSQRAHGLMVKQAEGQPVHPRRFDKPLLDIQLD